MTATKDRKALVDQAAVVATCQRLFGPGLVTELRALEATTAADRWPRTWFGYCDNSQALAAAAGTITTAKGIYIMPNEVNPALLARAANRIKQAGKGDATTQDSDILRRRWLLIDADPTRPAGISSSDDEHAAALGRVQDIVAYLAAAGWPGGIAADSGNGGHATYRIDLPADDGGLVQRCLQALAVRFDDAAVTVDKGNYNPARIWKLYGTLACKGDDVPGRPWRMARILQAPDALQVVPVELLQALAGEIPTVTPAAAAPRQDHGDGERFDIETFIRRYGLEVEGPHDWNGKQGAGRKWTFTRSPMCEHHGDGPFIVQHASGAVTAGCHHAHCAWTWQDLRQRLDGRPVKTGQRTTGSTAAGPATAKAATPTVEPYRPFPVDALPDPLDSFVNAAARSMVCDASFLALPLLAALAAAIGSTRRVALKRGWSEPAILWAAIVGESGTTKTPAFKLVTKPIRDLQRDALQLHAEEKARYETALVVYERDLTLWKRKSGDSDPPERPQQPQAVRYIVQDTTVEALAPLLLANPRGLLLARDELAGWLGSFDRYAGGSGGGDSAHWLSVHNGESLIVDRKTGPTKTIYVPHAYVSICGGIQPAILHRALGVEHRESGLAARLLLTCPPRRPKHWTDADIDPAAEAELGQLLARLYDLEPDTDDGGQPCPVCIGLAADAKRLWVEFYNAHGQEQVDLTGELAAAWSKLEGCAARLALIVHYARWAAGDTSLQHPDKIDADSMRRAVTLAEWFKAQARRVYGVLAESDEQRERRLLVEWIRRKGGAVTGRELQQGPRQYRGSTDAAEAALQELVKAGLGTWQDLPTTDKGGRPGRIFRLGDNGNGYTTPRNTEENRGSVAVASAASPETQDDDWGEV
ncbi:MAG: DUF3987 domain-containing protein [Candidatus Anammoximicrobium sp.]|nr:DUF3987 domain-containing protein [Candidatus Anammoximicrobium sp.]